MPQSLSSSHFCIMVYFSQVRSRFSASAQRLNECFVKRSLQEFTEFLRSLLLRGETCCGYPRSTHTATRAGTKAPSSWGGSILPRDLLDFGGSSMTLWHEGGPWSEPVKPRWAAQRGVKHCRLSLWARCPDRAKRERPEKWLNTLEQKSSLAPKISMDWARAVQAGPSPGTMLLAAVVITGTCWPFQVCPPGRCCQGIDENLAAGRSWHLVAAGQNYRKVAAREMSPPAVPGSQGPCRVFAPFILGMSLITWLQ